MTRSLAALVLLVVASLGPLGGVAAGADPPAGQMTLARRVGHRPHHEHKATTTFGETDRWLPTKIRLLRKSGRVDEASARTLKCSVDAPDWRRLCQEANQTPAGRARRSG